MCAWKSSRSTWAAPPVCTTSPGTNTPTCSPAPPHFAQAVLREAGSTARTVVLICRSGKRTLDAGAALEAAGFTDVVNVTHGFEGELDDHFHRSTASGWRFEGLPWEQM